MVSRLCRYTTHSRAKKRLHSHWSSQPPEPVPKHQLGSLSPFLNDLRRVLDGLFHWLIPLRTFSSVIGLPWERQRVNHQHATTSGKTYTADAYLATLLDHGKTADLGILRTMGT